MIIVFASQFDETAQHVVKGWPDSQAALLTVGDISTEGWCTKLNDFSKSTIIASGKRYSTNEISGIITLMPYIYEYELLSINEPDRRYVAAEMTAFLYYVFTSFNCPLINKPTPYNLTGPNWRYEEWLRACQRVSIPIKPYHRQALGDSHPNNAISSIITVLGDHIIRNTTDQLEALEAKVQQLAKLARVQFLEVGFFTENNQTFFAWANHLPSLADAQILTTLHSHFREDR